MNAIEKRARGLLAEALRQRNENRLAGMAEIPQGLDQVATHVALDAIIAALTPPEGYVLVPAEPTEAMVEAYHSVEAVTASSDEHADDQWAIESYKAMIAARPEVL